MSSARWPVATKEKPCLNCGHSNRCKNAPNGDAALCWRAGGKVIQLKTSSGNKSGYVGAAHRNPQSSKSSAKTFTTMQEAVDAAGKLIANGTLANIWHYEDAQGNDVMAVARFDTPDGKEFRPAHLKKDVWRVGDPSGPLPLYRLPRLVASTGIVYLAEGEKAADGGESVGLMTTTSAHGAESADKTDWSPLAGREVVILLDNDPAGAKYGRAVARKLLMQDTAAVIRLVLLPNLPPGGDIVEFLLANDHLDPESQRATIEKIARETPPIVAVDVIGGPVLTCLADVEPCEISWLWHGRIPLGRISLLVGRPGEGKSFLTTDMTARVTTGTPWPDGSDCPMGSVILISAEDDPADTIRPRLDAHQADVRRVHLLSAVRRIDEDGKPHEIMFSLTDVVALESALKTHPDCKLIVIDPIGSFMGGDVDAHRDNEVRGVLAPVARLAQKYGPAVLVVAHRRKGAGTSADDLALGSRAFTGIARTVWHLSRKSDADADAEAVEQMTGKKCPVRLLLPGKNNLAEEGDGLAFTIAGDPPSIRWDRDPVRMSADDALAVENGTGEERGRPPKEQDGAREWVLAELADLQEHPVADLQRDAKAAGTSWRTIQRAAAKLQVIRERSGFGGAFIWRLPKPGNLSPTEVKEAVERHSTNRATIRATMPKSENSGTNGEIGEFDEKRRFFDDLEHDNNHTCQNVFIGTNKEHAANGDGRERGEL
jgi:putative DNA primase/helicase